jgi:CBS domain-containing protein
MLVKALLESKPKEIVTARPSTSIDEAMDLLISKGIGCLPVMDESEKLVGILSDKDIFKKIHETKGQYHSLKVEDVMSTELIIGLPEDDITYIATVMDKNWIRHIPVLEGDALVGLISLRDIIKTQTLNTDIENRYLNMYMDMSHRRDKSGDV